MEYLGITVPVRNVPELDQAFIPMGLFNQAFLETAKKPVGFALERSGEQVAVCHTFLHGTPEMAQADAYYADRLVKCMLWMKGGDLILEEAKRVLADEYPAYADKLLPALPDEKTRRVGQSVAAASLPEVAL